MHCLQDMIKRYYTLFPGMVGKSLREVYIMIRHLVVLITLSIPLISIGQSYPNLIFHKTGSHLDAQFGTRLSGVGDQNGDGYNDFLVTEYSNLNQDSATTYLFYGGDSIDNQPDYVWEGFRCQSTRNGIATRITPVMDVGKLPWRSDLATRCIFSQDVIRRNGINPI